MRLRSALRGRDPSRAAPHVFDITRHGALHDSLAYQTLCRKEVYAPVAPPFRSLAVNAAVAAVKACAPLAEHLQRAALAHVGALETRLIVDETLDRAGRARLRRQLRLLLAPGRAVWENWVRQARDHELPRFDAMVRHWREQPLTNLGEAQWFVPGWYRQVNEVGAAEVFFAHLPAAVREYLAIELTDGVPLGYPGRCALLEMPVEEANRRARLLGARFRFKLDQ